MTRHLLSLFAWIALVIFGSARAGEVTMIVNDGAGKPMVDAVIAFYDGKTTALNTSGAGKIVQKNKMFNPKVSVVQTGTSIQFPNEDSVRHHVYSFSPAKKFELKLYSGVPTNPVPFDQAGLVTLGCNIHDSMVGYIYVVDTPFFAKTDDKGKAVFKLNDGPYSFQIWVPGQNKPSVEQKITIEGVTEVKIPIP